jgi:hypothetical protein
MLFSDHPTKRSSDHPRVLSDEWRIMADFIFNQDRSSFRRACQNINKGLYKELKVGEKLTLATVRVD